MSVSKFFLAALGMLAATHADGQLFDSFFGRPRQRFQSMPTSSIHGRAYLQPAQPIAGGISHIVLELNVEQGVGIETLQVGGLPDANGDILYGDGFENLTDIVSPSNRVTKRFQLPVRFLSPRTNEVALTIRGFQAHRIQQGGFSSVMSSGFGLNLDAFPVTVGPLPEKGRPTNFSGAIGERYRITQTVTPDHVHPGDLVTATYKLTWSGYFPSNVWPTVEHLAKDFKAYEPREVERTANSATWTQMLVPRTTAATNTALVSVNFFNTRTKRYEMARAAPCQLVFVSEQAASTENTSVVVTAETTAAEQPAPGTAPLVLHFAPSETSPVLATLPPGTPVKELARSHGWRRVETSRVVGWTR